VEAVDTSCFVRSLPATLIFGSSFAWYSNKSSCFPSFTWPFFSFSPKPVLSSGLPNAAVGSWIT